MHWVTSRDLELNPVSRGPRPVREDLSIDGLFPDT
jgi:hypothetical protein